MLMISVLVILPDNSADTFMRRMCARLKNFYFTVRMSISYARVQTYGFFPFEPAIDDEYLAAKTSAGNGAMLSGVKMISEFFVEQGFEVAEMFFERE